MLISRFATLFLIPVGLLFSFLGLIPITILQSISGILLGYGFLFIASKLFIYVTKREGIGQGDLDLLAFIGSFLGAAGCWISLFLGSIVGSLFGLLYMYIAKKGRNLKIPFGHFLAFGAMAFVLFGEQLKAFILGM